MVGFFLRLIHFKAAFRNRKISFKLTTDKEMHMKIILNWKFQKARACIKKIKKVWNKHKLIVVMFFLFFLSDG